jgi:Putative prokaryotic signal transducing protein
MEFRMTEKIVTIGRFTDPVEAALVRNRLEAAGIKAMVNGQEGSAIGWQISNSATIELIVFESDLEAAEEVLRYGDLSLDEIQERTAEEHPEGVVEPNAKSLHRSGITTPEDVEEEEEPSDPQRANIDRSFRAALLSVLFSSIWFSGVDLLFVILFFPIWFYAAYLLFGVLTEDRPIPPDRRAKVWGAIVIWLLGGIPIVLLLRLSWRLL